MKVSELIKSEVNIHGEIHLDAHNAQLLIRYLESTENIWDEQVEAFKELVPIALKLKNLAAGE
ncbi:MAG: hypothetical protein H0X02_13050 [Nitrosomonas sp.]|nr:hypothetical protein [Nitrosomonas sp.]